MAKRYIRVNWQNKPSTSTPMSATNFNKMDKGIDDLDNAIEDIYGNKIDKANIANNLVTTTTGLVLDASQGKNLQDQVTTINNNLPNIGYTNEGIKNSIYRGKNLGSAVTAKQYADIANGSFTDLYIGDHWTINGINWRIAAFNYYRNTGDNLVPGNHITLVSDTTLYDHIMNDTNITTGGYIGSKMYTEGLEQAKTTIRGIFGTHLLKHRQILSNATADGRASGWAWIDSEVELMNEIMVYGSIVWGESTIGGSGYNIGVGKSQLPLFALNPRMINTRQNYWLRDVVSATHFAYVGYTGRAYCYNASTALGVRPAFSIS